MPLTLTSTLGYGESNRVAVTLRYALSSPYGKPCGFLGSSGCGCELLASHLLLVAFPVSVYDQPIFPLEVLAS